MKLSICTLQNLITAKIVFSQERNIDSCLPLAQTRWYMAEAHRFWSTKLQDEWIMTESYPLHITAHRLLNQFIVTTVVPL